MTPVTNGYFPRLIPTNRGNVEISQIVPGDFVYLYMDPKEMSKCNTKLMSEVKRVIQKDTCSVWRIEYSDGRTQFVDQLSNIYTGVGITSLYAAFADREKLLAPIKQAQVDWYPGVVRSPLMPDPYIAGALITHGDYDDEYINLPLDRDSADSFFGDKYQVDYAEKLGNNRIYVRWKNGPEEIPITWREFFPKQNFFAKTHQLTDKLIPDDYMYASTKDRIQYIRGAFDVGYDTDMFPDEVAIASRDEYRLRKIQYMLWSLGIVSGVTYDPNLLAGRDRLYRLDVLSQIPDPGFFYDINKIEHQILNEPRRYCKKKFNLNIVRAEKVGIGYTHELILEDHEMIYLDDLLLPRVSL